MAENALDLDKLRYLIRYGIGISRQTALALIAALEAERAENARLRGSAKVLAEAILDIATDERVHRAGELLPDLANGNALIVDGERLVIDGGSGGAGRYS